MGRHVSGNCPELDRLVDDACVEMGREIAALCIPRLAGVVLGGGYGRGEGGVKEKLEARVGVGETIMFGSSSTGNQAFMSGNSTIRDGRHIGEKAIVGMGSVVVKNVDKGTVVKGNPAK